MEYNNYIKTCLLTNGAITYNAIILLVYELFRTNASVRQFYHKYFPVIFIDEFQDTNCISWLLINEIISINNKITFMGDSLQRIYGFIGAVPDLMNIAERELSMRKIVLKTNYRFNDVRIDIWTHFMRGSIIELCTPKMKGVE